MCACPLSCESCRSQPHVKMSGMQSMEADRLRSWWWFGRGRRFGHAAGSGVGDEDGLYSRLLASCFVVRRWCCSCSENLKVK